MRYIPVRAEARDYGMRVLGHVVTTIVDALRRHSVAFAVAALLATYLSKIYWYIDFIAGVRGVKMQFLAFFAQDLVFWGAFIAAVWALETLVRRRWALAVTTTSSIILFLVSLANVFYLRGTGTQLHLAVVEVGLARTEEIMPILGAGIGSNGAYLFVLALGLPVLLPFLFRAKWVKDGHGEQTRPASFSFPALLLALGVVGFVEQRSADVAGWRLVADNIQTSLVVDALTRPKLFAPPSSTPDPAPPVAGTAAPSPDAPNIVIIVLEATSLRATSLDPSAPVGATPFLEGMAKRGLFSSHMRTVVPHTSKALFSMLCGTYPALQHQTVETASNYPARCLPHILREHGYATAFIQSASGKFEDRPRLVSRLGFDDFVAAQGISNLEHLGYLAANDVTMSDAAIEWGLSHKGPSLLFVLTSETHHPYQLPARIRAKIGAAADGLSPRNAYQILVRDLDLVVQRIVTALETRADGRDTIFLVFGDHGESFGDHGAFQHDNIYTEEGLRVPFVIVAPKRIPAGTRVDGNRSLLDVMPTVLDLAGIPFRRAVLPGTSLLAPELVEPRRYFACWFNQTCAGFIEKEHKLVWFPTTKSWIVYDLARDPNEIAPLFEPPDWRGRVDELARWYHARRYDMTSLQWPAIRPFNGQWSCAEGFGRCERGVIR
jgi:lipoteichoic acid synthase